jgi:hypothetical protein
MRSTKHLSNFEIPTFSTSHPLYTSLHLSFLLFWHGQSIAEFPSRSNLVNRSHPRDPRHGRKISPNGGDGGVSQRRPSRPRGVSILPARAPRKNLRECFFIQRSFFPERSSISRWSIYPSKPWSISVNGAKHHAKLTRFMGCIGVCTRIYGTGRIQYYVEFLCAIGCIALECGPGIYQVRRGKCELRCWRSRLTDLFWSVSNRDSQFIIAQAAQTTEGDGKYDLLGDGVYTGCSTLDASSWNICKVNTICTSSFVPLCNSVENSF